MDIAPCKKKRKIKTKKESKKGMKMRGDGRASGEREKIFFFSFLFKIYGNRIIGFRRNKRQSQSTHQELHVDTKILEFRQTP